MGGAFAGLGGGQVKVGETRDTLQLSVIGCDEDRIEGAGSRAPGDGDAVADGLAEAVQLLWSHGVGRLGGGGLSERVGERQPGGQSLFDMDVGDQSGAGDLDDADGGGTLEVNLVSNPPAPAHSVHVHVGVDASERTGAGVLWTMTS